MNKVKYLLIGLGLVFAGIAFSEPPLTETYIVTQNPHPAHAPTSSAETAVDDIISIILDQGFAGAIIVVLFGYIWREGKNNRAIHQENFDKFVAISGECSGHMAEVSSKLDGIERELEQTKTLELMKRS